MFSALILHTLLAAASASASSAWVEPSFRNYGTAEGLPSSNIDTLAQDGQGYIWIATESGLVRYDGNRFRVWRHDPRDPRSLSAMPSKVFASNPPNSVRLSIESWNIQ